MKLSVLILFPFLLVSSCGKKIELPKKEAPVSQTTYSNSPVFLKAQEQQCLSESTSRNSSLRLYLFLNGRHEVQYKNLYFRENSNLLKNNSLIKRTLFGEKSETLITQDSTKSLLIENGKDLVLCRETREYSPLSVESVALNAAYYMNLTKNKFNKLFPQIHVTPVTLNLLPSVQRSIIVKNASGQRTKISSYLTDNAFYMPKYSSITFLPHSLDMKKQGLNTNFWEVPMIISHEYGHHLFQMIYQGQIDSTGVHSCFGEMLKKEDISNKRLNYRSVKHSDIINAYNEAFADLVAYYSLDEEYSIRGVKCLEYSRDISSSTFFDGTLKVFGQKALDSFFSNTKASPRSCESPNFQEPHILGAIFAHNVDAYMSLFTDSKEEKFTVLVNWLNYLKVNKLNLERSSAEEFLKETYKVFLRLATTRLQGTFSLEACRTIFESYPDLQMDECLF